jgi:NAD(P)-dependent dehydrogenase (short-subunit alcohol dehydrogenase family)
MPMSLALNERVVAVTGAFGNLGQALVQLLAERGAKVVLIDRAASLPEQATCPAGGLLLCGIDLTSAASAEQAAACIEQQFSRLDGLVNVAGGFSWETLADGELESWDRLYALNLRSTVCTSKALLPLLKCSEQGRIVNVGAAAATRATIGMGPYAASKAGVLRLTESLADELKQQGITVNAVLPSILDTPQNRQDMPDAEYDDWVKPEQLAAVIGFLLSAEASAITGAGIPVTGRV